MKEYQKFSVFVLVFIYILLFLEVCFELLDKKIILVSLVSGLVGGGFIYFVSRKYNK